MPLPLLLLRFRLLGVPGLLLVALLQRMPVLRVLAGGLERGAVSPAGHIMRSIFTAGALGAIHGRAGATTFAKNPSVNPVPGNVGAPFQMTFTYIGTPSLPQSYRVTGQLPPGLRFNVALTSGSLIVRGQPVIISGTPTEAGNYTITVQGFGLAGNGLPETINFAITGDAPAVAPTITRQPASQTVGAGTNATFTVTATGTPAPAFQWWRNGQPIAGATAATLPLPAVQAGDAGTYSVVVTNAGGSVTSSAATLTVFTPNPGARLANLSVRTSLAAGGLLTVGVVVADGSRNILFRAAGPALNALGLAGAMDDPSLEIYREQTRQAGNDTWAPTLAPVFASVGAFGFPDASRDAALVQPLDAAYSVQVRGTGAGVVLVEAYDTGAVTAARMVNVSARNQVGTGDDILIAGFNLSGTGSKPLLIRAVGPTLAGFGVAGTLADPQLEIYQGGTRVAQNDNWSESLASLFGAVGAFGLTTGSRDAALVVSLPPGSYTAQVRGADGGTGEALIEIYELK
jgi:hypothetical protein